MSEVLSINSLWTAAQDMTRPHDAPLSGASTLDFHERPRLAWGEEPEPRWTAAIHWGQVYEPRGGNPATNTRVQIRNLRLIVKRKSDGQWHVLQDTSEFSGAFYREDFANNDSWSAWQRDEAEGASICLPNGAGRNYHFWPTEGRVSFPLADIDEVVSSVDARLVRDNWNLPDDSDQARLLMGVGADYWESPTAAWDNWTTNGDIGIGRHRWITPQWQTYTMTTLTQHELITRVIPEPAAVGIAFVIGGLLAARQPRRGPRETERP
ncbi:MAG: hypothetical protein AAF916_09015 [Planctomycetota bacterium]